MRRKEIYSVFRDNFCKMLSSVISDLIVREVDVSQRLYQKMEIEMRQANLALYPPCYFGKH